MKLKVYLKELIIFSNLLIAHETNQQIGLTTKQSMIQSYKNQLTVFYTMETLVLSFELLNLF